MTKVTQLKFHHIFVNFLYTFLAGQECVNEDPQISISCDTNDINSLTRSKNQIIMYIFSIIKFFLYL